MVDDTGGADIQCEAAFFSEGARAMLWRFSGTAHRRRLGTKTARQRLSSGWMGWGEIIWRILGYGDQVQVLAPRELRDRVVAAAKNIIKLNTKL